MPRLKCISKNEVVYFMFSLLADDSHLISRLILHGKKGVTKFWSAAVVIGAEFHG